MGADENIKGEADSALVTKRTCRGGVTNNWGVDLASITLRHLKDNENFQKDEMTWFNVAIGQTTPADLVINYETGKGAAHDYWWVTFQLNNGDVYASSPKFECELREGDDGGVVWANIDQQDASLIIVCPFSGSCKSESIILTSGG